MCKCEWSRHREEGEMCANGATSLLCFLVINNEHSLNNDNAHSHDSACCWFNLVDAVQLCWVVWESSFKLRAVPFVQAMKWARWVHKIENSTRFTSIQFNSQWWTVNTQNQLILWGIYSMRELESDKFSRNVTLTVSKRIEHLNFSILSCKRHDVLYMSKSKSQK